MSERCEAIQTLFEPFEVCREARQDEWVNELNVAETENDDRVESIHYEDVEICVAPGKSAAPEQRLCSATRIDSDTGEVMGVIYGAFKCIKK